MGGVNAGALHGNGVTETKTMSLGVILDRSGSMSTIRKDMEGGFNQYIKEQRTVPGSMKVSLFQFDTEYEEVYRGVDVKDVPELDLIPRGGTALLDAVVRAVGVLKECTAPTDKVVVVIITDGEENSSFEATQIQVKDLIEERTKAGWEFVYLGANVDAFGESRSMGIGAVNTMSYDGTTKSVNTMFSSLSNSTSRSRTGEDSDTGGYFNSDEQDARDE